MNVEELVDEELERASQKHSDKFVSRHQAYAVLKEEIEELSAEVKRLNSDLEDLWCFIKRDSTNVQELLKSLEVGSKNAIEEAIQVSAMVKKTLNMYKEKFPDSFKYYG